MHHFKKLERLNLTHAPLTDADLVHVGKVKSLRYLKFSGLAIQGHGLASLAGLKNLETLTITGCIDSQKRSSGFDALMAMINGEPVLMELKTLPKIPALRELSFGPVFRILGGNRGFGGLFNNAILTPGAFEAIGKQSRLEKLDLRNCRFKGEYLHSLSELAIKEVYLSEAAISIDQLRSLANVSSIECLYYEQCQGIEPDELAEYINDAKHLRVLHVFGMPRSDALVDAVCNSPQLTSFELERSNLTPIDVARINGNPKRKPITLSGVLAN